MQADPPGFMAEARVAVVGLGLMGGSLALSLRGKCRSLLGVDPSPEVVSLAMAKGIVDEASTDPAALLPGADWLVLAAPVLDIIRTLRRLPELHPGPAWVVDLGSTKRCIVEAMADLPQRFDPLGGHPMCGKELGGLEHAEPGLYEGAPFIFTALERTTDLSRANAKQLAAALGARLIWMDADTHDHWVSAVSHLPYLVASALAATVPLEVAGLAGPGYRGTTRLASSPLTVMHDILATNRENILADLRKYRLQLARIESLLELNDLSGLQAELARASRLRGQILEKQKDHTGL